MVINEIQKTSSKYSGTYKNINQNSEKFNFHCPHGWTLSIIYLFTQLLSIFFALLCDFLTFLTLTAISLFRQDGFFLFLFSGIDLQIRLEEFPHSFPRTSN
uniref:Uncharacterized protein n=1 Tax=Megaselia scalaris TaxID=36166 RepID=T1GHU4_MEGSC